jgi:hypothetical protein
MDYELNKTIISFYGKKLILLSEEKIFLISIAKIEKLRIILYSNKLKNDIFLGIMDFNSIYKNQYLITSRNICKFRYESEFKHFENVLISLTLNKNLKNKNLKGKFEENFKEKTLENIYNILKEMENFIQIRDKKREICKKCEENQRNNKEILEDSHECMHKKKKRSKFSRLFEINMDRLFTKMKDIDSKDSDVFSKK